MWKGYFSINNKKKLDKFDLVWVDIYRRYLIYRTSSLKHDIPYARDRFRQVDNIPSADTYRSEF